MKQTRITSLITFLALLLPATWAHAAGMVPYMGLSSGVFSISHSEPGLNQKNNVFGGYIETGVDFPPFIGVEVRLGATTTGSNDYPGVAGAPGIPGVPGYWLYNEI